MQTFMNILFYNIIPNAIICYLTTDAIEILLIELYIIFLYYNTNF